MSMLDREILALMRDVTETAILPHFRSLSASQIENKALKKLRHPSIIKNTA